MYVVAPSIVLEYIAVPYSCLIYELELYVLLANPIAASVADLYGSGLGGGVAFGLEQPLLATIATTATIPNIALRKNLPSGSEYITGLDCT